MNNNNEISVKDVFVNHYIIHYASRSYTLPYPVCLEAQLSCLLFLTTLYFSWNIIYSRKFITDNLAMYQMIGRLAWLASCFQLNRMLLKLVIYLENKLDFIKRFSSRRSKIFGFIYWYIILLELQSHISSAHIESKYWNSWITALAST